MKPRHFTLCAFLTSYTVRKSADHNHGARDLQPYLSQIVLISATFPERVIEYAEFFAPRANMITLQHHELVQPKIKQLIMDCTSEEDKYRALAEMWRLVVVGSCIIFVAVFTTSSNNQTG